MALKNKNSLFLYQGPHFILQKYLLYSLINVATNFTKKIILALYNATSLLENYFKNL
jgi:hypothetical protein